MDEDVLKSPQNVNFHSIAVLIASVLVLGFLFTWDLLIYSTTWTLQILIFVYISINFCCFWFGFLRDSDRNFKWNKQIKFNKKVKDYAKALSVFGTSTAIFYAATVLLGAPFFNRCLETLEFSVLLSSIITFPGILSWGGDESKWIRIVFGSGAQSTWESVWLRNAAFCLFGGWLGAFVIPLDWDRPWQLWPISCTYGCLVGYTVGLVYNIHQHQRWPMAQTQQRKLV